LQLPAVVAEEGQKGNCEVFWRCDSPINIGSNWQIFEIARIREYWTNQDNYENTVHI
jgi:hypothetical protein